jgi:hypothetical protein
METAMNKTIYLLVFLCTCSVFSVSAWNVPEAVTNNPGQFTADLDPYISYQNSTHIYMIQNAIRLFRAEGKTNWANLLEQNLQALADGATYADKHKGRVVARLYFEVLWGLWSHDLYTYDIGPLGGFDHYYDPNTGQGLRLEMPVLSNFCLDVLAQYLLDLGGLAGLKFEVNPRDIFHNYHSAVDL